MENKWIKLYKKMLDWKWYKNQNTKDLFIHCLLKANWKDGYFENVKVEKGSFVTSHKRLSEELNHLKSTGELTIKRHPKFLVISINNYDKYQATNNETNNQLTINQQSTNNQLTTIEEYKNNRILDIDERNNACAREEVFEYDWLNEED